MLHFSKSISAMLTSILGFLLLLSSAIATPPPQLVAPSLNVPPPDRPNTSASNALNIFRCFDPEFPPPGPFYPITYSACTETADEFIADARVDVPLTFSRRENADVPLPWRVRSGNAMMTLDVLNQDDEDIMRIKDVHELALALCKMCVRDYYRCGGTTPVGPKGMVHISVYATGSGTVEGGLPQTSRAAARNLERRGPTVLSPSLLASFTTSILSVSDTEDGECFSESGTSARQHLYPVKSIDCKNAAVQMSRHRRDHVHMKFGRSATGDDLDFKLPWTARNNSCIVSVDTLQNDDSDKIVLWEVYQTALDRIEKCTTGGNIFGGRRAVGPKNVVQVSISGFGPPVQGPASSPIAAGSEGGGVA